MTTAGQIDAAVMRLADKLRGEALEDLHWLAGLARTAVPTGQAAEDAQTVGDYAFETSKSLPFLNDARAALSRLAAGAQRADKLRHDAADAKTLCERLSQSVDTFKAQVNDIRKRSSEATNLECLISEHGLPAAMRWVVEGEIPSDDRPYPERHPHVFLSRAGGSDFCNAACGNGRLCGWPREAHRWPCSDTCTHEDAAIEGHPERVKGLSAKVAREALNCTTQGRAPDVDPRLDARAKELGVAEDTAFNEGAEAMRLSCLQAVHAALEEAGLLGSPLAVALRRNIEGSTP